MPINLHELGIDPTDDQIKEMAEKCVATGGGTVGFFQPLNKDDIIKNCVSYNNPGIRASK